MSILSHSLAAAALAALAALSTGTEPELAANQFPERTQELELRAGWNSVWLEVSPADTAADAVFADLPVDVCARHLRPVAGGEFIRNPAEQPFNQEGWSVWYAPTREDAAIRTLDRIHGHAAYLVHARAACRWTVAGTQQFRSHRWKHGGFTLAGFAVDPERPPTFAQYFAGAAGRVGSRIFRLVDDRWQLAAPATRIRPGEACWVYAEGDSDYQGPVTVDLGLPALDFGTTSERLALKLVNSSAGEATLSAELLAPGAAGTLPIQQVDLHAATLTTTTHAVTGSGTVLPGGTAETLRLSLRRDLMAQPAQTALLKITDGAGACVLVPVRGQK